MSVYAVEWWWPLRLARMSLVLVVVVILHIHVHLHQEIHVHVQMHMYRDICTYVKLHIHVYMYIYIWIFVYSLECVYIYIYTRYIHIYIIYLKGQEIQTWCHINACEILAREEGTCLTEALFKEHDTTSAWVGCVKLQWSEHREICRSGRHDGRSMLGASQLNRNCNPSIPYHWHAMV